MLRINPFALTSQQTGAFGFQNQGGYMPVNLNNFLQTGDVFQSGGSQQDILQMMQAQMLASLLMQLDPSMLVQLALMSLLNQMRGGGGGGGFGAAPSAAWAATDSRAVDRDLDGTGPTAGQTRGGPTVLAAKDKAGIPDGLRANAANGARVVREMGFRGEIDGLGERSGKSDHPHGNAIDADDPRRHAAWVARSQSTFARTTISSA